MTLTFRLLFGGLAWLLCVNSAWARLEPSFHLEQATWDATHVVLVEPDRKREGAVRIVESWKGDLKPGDEAPLGLTSGGLQAILFLYKSLNDKGVVTWEAATGGRTGDQRFPYPMSISIISIKDGDKAYAVQQLKVPGPARLLPLGSETIPQFTEAQVKEEVLRLVELQRALQSKLQLEDPVERAKAIRPLIQAKCWHAWQEGFAALRECGPAAVTAWCELLQDEALLARHVEILQQLTRYRGKEVSQALTEVIEQELAFWKNAAPKLPVEWREGRGVSPNVAMEVQQHHRRLTLTLEILSRQVVPSAAKPAGELREYWLSLPQLDGQGPREISKLCERILEAMGQRVRKEP